MNSDHYAAHTSFSSMVKVNPTFQKIHNRHLVVQGVKDKLSVRAIAKKYKLSHKFCRTWANRYKKTGAVDRQKGSGAPRKLKPSEYKKLKATIKKENSCATAAEKFKVSHVTAWRYSQLLNLKCKKRKRAPRLTDSQKAERLAFAKKYVKKPLAFWKKWVFSDEKKYYMFQLKKTQWCDADEEPEVQGTWAVPPQCYIWAAVSWHGKTKLRKINGGLTAPKYIEILKDTLLPAKDDLAADPTDWTFQQDQTSRGAHGAHLTRRWLAENVPHTCFPWPANSPDLNIIENVWRILNHEIQKKKPKTADAYWRALQRCWNTQVAQEKIQNLVKSMQRRLRAVIAADGGNTKY